MVEKGNSAVKLLNLQLFCSNLSGACAFVAAGTGRGPSISCGFQQQQEKTSKMVLIFDFTLLDS